MTQISYFSKNQKIEVEVLLCYGYEISNQLPTGTVVLTSFSSSAEGLHVKDEVYVFDDGHKVMYD